MTRDLAKNYALSPVEASSLAEKIDEFTQTRRDVIEEGQVLYTAVCKDEPAGKALKDCEMVEVKLTLWNSQELARPGSPEGRRRVLVHRLCWEAFEQGGLLTVEDLAHLLICSTPTVKRIVSGYRKEDVFVPTRGNYRDIGPGTSHKAQAVRLYLKGFLPEEIGRRMGHNIHSVERYLDDFVTVWMGLEDGFSPARLARNTRISEWVIKQYQALAEEYAKDPDYAPMFARLRERMGYLLQKRGPEEGCGIG
jgi:hypothetical protein